MTAAGPSVKAKRCTSAAWADERLAPRRWTPPTLGLCHDSNYEASDCHHFLFLYLQPTVCFLLLYSLVQFYIRIGGKNMGSTCTRTRSRNEGECGDHIIWTGYTNLISRENVTMLQGGGFV